MGKRRGSSSRGKEREKQAELKSVDYIAGYGYVVGLNVKVVQEILGHSQITMTLDVYSHALPSMQEDVTKQWDSEFGPQAKKKQTKKRDK